MSTSHNQRKQLARPRPIRFVTVTKSSQCVFLGPKFACSILHVFRFIDDLNSINDYGEFEQSIKDIYPPELELGKENGEPTRASFLDLDIKIVDQVFVFNQYDKRDDFPFSIVRLPFACSNMPSKLFY